MLIRSVRHKALRNLIEKDSAAGLPAAVVPKIRSILYFLQVMAAEDELRDATAWKPHLMTGDRAGTWALHVTRNWRITFRVDQQEIAIIDLDYEDYH
jgi:proteic killer suppression protein